MKRWNQKLAHIRITKINTAVVPLSCREMVISLILSHLNWKYTILNHNIRNLLCLIIETSWKFWRVTLTMSKQLLINMLILFNFSSISIKCNLPPAKDIENRNMYSQKRRDLSPITHRKDKDSPRYNRNSSWYPKWLQNLQLLLLNSKPLTHNLKKPNSLSNNPNDW